MGILNLIAASTLTTNMGVQPVASVESDSIEVESTETAQIGLHNVTADAVISEMIPNAVNGLLPLTVCTTTGCGTCENQTSEGGTISSPDYPQDYGNDCACIYTIRVPVDRKIHLSFTVFYVEFQYDWIDVYDGISSQISANITLSSSLTGNDLPRDRNSTANVMTIHFVSDLDNTEIPSEQTGRWQAKYKAI
uniref:CUB domain-containing protein n=1 Tax=Daphnia galeata TaxID=27404 RepID=A0A8J2WJV6_9CRUS|nr:unnamed protein product [Daphnia galeata]